MGTSQGYLTTCVVQLIFLSNHSSRDNEANAVHLLTLTPIDHPLPFRFSQIDGKTKGCIPYTTVANSTTLDSSRSILYFFFERDTQSDRRKKDFRL